MATGQFLPFETADPLASTTIRLDPWHLDERAIPADL